MSITKFGRCGAELRVGFFVENEGPGEIDMNDNQFISILNTASREHELVLHAGQGEHPSGALLHAWARFLEACMQKGVDLGDPRWQHVALSEGAPYARFALQAAGRTPADKDPDFRVGLQLLLGLLGGHDR
jgi:hypothetical protein